MLKLTIVLLAVALAQVLAAPATISPSLKQSLKTKGTANVLVIMKEKTSPILSKLKMQSFATREARLNQVAGSLKSLAAASQKSVLAYLATKDNLKVTSLWISNKIAVKGASAELIQSLAGMEQVESIIEDGRIPWKHPKPSAPARVPSPKAIQWGVEIIEAPQAWAEGYTGNGVVVATIDTGVLYTHKNLYGNFRHDYGWFDPYSSTETPEDGDGHGSHTTGTIAGLDGIGVAPGAKWIACRGCDSFGCEFSTLEECGQFTLCPTKPDGTEANCTYAAHVVSNSWGGGGGQDFYDGVIEAWTTAGIIPVFSNGNSGSACETTGSPADSNKNPVIGVGATDDQDELAYFSSRGPSTFDASIIKPDISAPGVDVVSSSGSNNDGFETLSGTSMACPHVAGAAALLLTNGTQLDFEVLAGLLYGGATDTIGNSGETCGGVADTVYPNNHVGYGRLSVTGSIKKLKEFLARR